MFCKAVRKKLDVINFEEYIFRDFVTLSLYCTESLKHHWYFYIECTHKKIYLQKALQGIFRLQNKNNNSRFNTVHAENKQGEINVTHQFCMVLVQDILNLTYRNSENQSNQRHTLFAIYSITFERKKKYLKKVSQGMTCA